MNRVKRAGATVAIAVLLTAAVRAQVVDSTGTLAPGAAGKGALTLSVDDIADAGGKRLQASVQPAGQTPAVSAAVDVVGFPSVTGGQWGDVDWKVSGSTVTGTVRTRAGEMEGTFVGTITKSGVSGTFTHRDGRVGLWSWNGAPPSAPANAE